MSKEIPHGNRLLQIHESDLAELEHAIPLLCEVAMQSHDNNRSRVQIRRVKEILSNVRWNYGPWSDVTIIPAGDEPPGDGGST